MPGTLIWDQWKDRLAVSRRAHGLWDFTHVLLPTAMPLKQYYRALLGTYLHASFSPRRFQQVRQPNTPSFYSVRFLRLWVGALRIAWQLFRAHRHHRPAELARAEYRGPDVSDLSVLTSRDCPTQPS
jgi:hopanoid C-3 methylase